MSAIRVRVRGLPELATAFRAALASIEAQAEGALDVGAGAGQDYSKEECPVKTGRLRDSLVIERERLKRSIWTDVPYSIFVHQGTYKMAARPFLFNGSERSIPMFEQASRAVKV